MWQGKCCFSGDRGYPVSLHNDAGRSNSVKIKGFRRQAGYVVVENVERGWDFTVRLEHCKDLIGLSLSGNLSVGIPIPQAHSIHFLPALVLHGHPFLYFQAACSSNKRHLKMA